MKYLILLTLLATLSTTLTAFPRYPITTSDSSLGYKIASIKNSKDEERIEKKLLGSIISIRIDKAAYRSEGAIFDNSKLVYNKRIKHAKRTIRIYITMKLKKNTKVKAGVKSFKGIIKKISISGNTSVTLHLEEY